MSPFRNLASLAPALLLGALLVSAGAPSSAHAATATFVIKDLVLSCPGGQNGIVNPFTQSQPGVCGHILWTYTPGDFANGSGKVLDLSMPITTFPSSSAIFTVDNTGITGSQPGNVHDITYDFTMNFSPALSSPTSVASIAPSSAFDFTGSYFYAPGLYFSGEWLGTFSGGSIVPQGSIADVGAQAPRLSFAAPQPNPSHGATTLAWTLADTNPVELSIFAVTGQRIAVLVSGPQSAGAHHTVWSGRDASGHELPAGVYLARLQTGSGEGREQRLVLVR
jgi:hypothetical protein